MRFTSLLHYKNSAWVIFAQDVTSKPCLHCEALYTVKCHGSLYGVDLHKPESLRRGLRFYCSNRYSNQGCGRTFSIHFNTVIPYQTVSASYLSIFFSKLLDSDTIHQAWHDSFVPFSLRCAYRWVKKLRLNLPNLRHRLHKLWKSTVAQTGSIERETLTIIRKLFPSSDYLAQAQLKLQFPILQSKASSS